MNIPFFLLTALLVILPSQLFAAHGISIDGKLKYPPDFKRFEYTSTDAVKGGALVLHDLGSFDKMNPFTLKGSAPFGLDSLIFETLAVGSLDEPFAEYGLIAKDIELAPDKRSVVFTIHEKARFSDNTPITPEDVKYSLETLKSDKAHPFYQIYLQDITAAEILDSRRVKFTFTRPNRELHMIASQLPVLNKKFYEQHGFDPSEKSNSMLPPIGSGPYLITEVNTGKSITFQRNPDYWAKDLPVRKGMFNFDTITVKYFKDQIVSVEAFKAGEFDFMVVNIAKQWQRDLKGRRFDSDQLVKKHFPHKNNAGMQGFVFNTRRPLFKDPQVRQALGLALDFEWINKTLFFDQYTRNTSYFSNSELAATGLPQGKELEMLQPFKDALPPEVFSQPLAAPSTKPPGSLRGNLRKAKQLLSQQGWAIKDGVLKNKEGQPFLFEILLVSPSFERVMAPYVKNLKKLGIQASYRTIDPALYSDRIKSFDFDMVVNVYGQSQSPGNEQRDYWSSLSTARKGSRNLAGVESPVVDSLVDAIIYATTRNDLTAACRAFDRVLWYGYYVVPNWYLASHRLAYSAKFRQPKTLPLYYNPYQLLFTWWEGK
ncbi:MAG: ABC transporter substrate-binding protein [Desulfobulbaceae bacterium]|nr:ABC transporter substrate-binding protein [Desulfobulbaceae bacterium]